MVKINICEDFSKSLGGRYEKEGTFSGEQFRKEILIPKYQEAISHNEKLFIDLDGCYGFPTSFLEESFGGLARELQDDSIDKNMEFKCEDEPSIIEKIKQYIKDSMK